MALEYLHARGQKELYAKIGCTRDAIPHVQLHRRKDQRLQFRPPSNTFQYRCQQSTHHFGVKVP